MRCSNCGWVNPDSATRCEKCNSPLSAPAPIESSIDNSIDLKSTVREADSIIESAPIASNAGDSCPHCGYPLRPGTDVCPNCKQPIKKMNTEENTPMKKDAPKTVNVPNYGATVNPWNNPLAGKTFKLEPVAWENESAAIAPVNFSGDYVQLKRENTDPTNNTITSKVQAEITNENGKWFIQDKSSQNSTLVHAGRKIELEDGDIIILGNRKFTFKA